MPKVKVCFICGVIDKNSDKSLIFVPLGKLEEWQKLISKPGLTKASRLCEAHFENNEIHKGNKVGNNFVPAIRNRFLTKNVVPTKNLAGIETSKRTRMAFKPCILDTGSTAEGPRLRTEPRTKKKKPQPWPPELVAAITSLVHPDGCHRDAVIRAVLPPMADVVAKGQENASVCDHMTNKDVQSSIYTNGYHAEAVIPDASRYSSLATGTYLENTL